MNKTNILFLFSDQHRWEWIGALGSIPVLTPNIDRIAARGVTFTSCRSNSPMCAPARACLAAGLRYHRVGVLNNRYDLDPRHDTFMKRLRASGYRVEVSGKTDLHKLSQLHGIDGWSERLGQLGFTDAFDHAGKRDSPVAYGYPDPYEPYMAYMQSHGLAETVNEDYKKRAEFEKAGNGVPTWPCPYERKHHIDDFGARAAIARIQRLPRSAPWFLQVNLGSPHPPFDAPPELTDQYESTTFPSPVAAADGPTDHQSVRRRYAASIQGIDEWIGRMIDAVEARGELANTMVVFSADHGDMLGDRGLWNKGFPDDGSTRVPLLMMGPGCAHGVSSDAVVELADLAATFVDAAGIPVPPAWDARSLLPVLGGSSLRHRRYSVSAFGRWRMITDGRWKLTLTDSDGEDGRHPEARLIDLAEDPFELHNRAAAEPEKTNELGQALSAELRGTT